jgi:Family of unknown function (DUF6404)
MRFEEKLTAALGLLASTGMWRSNYAPPYHRLLWKLGAKTPPPHFRSFTANFVSAGVLFGIVMWFAWWPSMSVGRAFIGSIFAGVLFGLCEAARYRYGARKYRIPLWRDFNPADDARI